MKDFFKEVTVTIPPKDKVTFSIPVKDEWKEDESFEASILTDTKIDPKIRIVCNSLLKSYKFCHWWFFVKREKKDKMNTKNMEALQLMKDVIMWYIRYDDLKLAYYIGKWVNKKKHEYSWDIAEDFSDVTYYVWEKKYKTNIFWVYTRKLRKSMFRHKFKFYWGHELQYMQRWFDLNYWAMNYWCASRFSGKTMFGVFNNLKVLFKSPTAIEEMSDKRLFKSHFFVTSLWVVEDYSTNLKEFFYNLLVKTYKLKEEAANQIVEWKSSKNTMYLHLAEESRPFEFVSELASSKRWERSGIVTMDEANYLKKYQEASWFAAASLAWSVNQISTISEDSKKTLFYKNWVREMLIARNARPIDDIIHTVWTKFWFDKIESREDYRKMAEDWTLEKARAHFFKLRPTFAMKSTLDDIERMSEEVKDVKISQSIASVNWYDWMLAEYYCELMPDKPVINYRPNLLEASRVPKFFDRIYFWYDEAEGYDDAWFVAIWVVWKIWYAIEAHILPVWIQERYAYMNQVIMRLESKSKVRPTMIMDIWRWPIYYRETSANVRYCDEAIKWRSWTHEKVNVISGVSYYSVGTAFLVETVIKNELLWLDKLFISDDLSADVELETQDWTMERPWLVSQLDNYIKTENWTYKWKGKKRDDLVSAFLYCAYYAYTDSLKSWSKMAIAGDMDTIDRLDIEFDKAQYYINKPKPRSNTSLRDIR